MKKLITILFMFSFLINANAQIKRTWKFNENWSPKIDKGLHFGAGIIIAAPSLLLLYNATNEWGGSTNASILIVACAAAGKETFDMLKQIATNKGGGYSWADFTYTIVGGLVFIFIADRIMKRKQRKWKAKFDISFI